MRIAAGSRGSHRAKRLRSDVWIRSERQSDEEDRPGESAADRVSLRSGESVVVWEREQPGGVFGHVGHERRRAGKAFDDVVLLQPGRERDVRSDEGRIAGGACCWCENLFSHLPAARREGREGSGRGEARLSTFCGASESEFTATRLEYARNGEAVSYVLGERWCWDGVPVNPVSNYTVQ